MMLRKSGSVIDTYIALAQEDAKSSKQLCQCGGLAAAHQHVVLLCKVRYIWEPNDMGYLFVYSCFSVFSEHRRLVLLYLPGAALVRTVLYPEEECLEAAGWERPQNLIGHCQSPAKWG